MSSTVLGCAPCEPYGQPNSSFVFCVNSYLPSSLFFMSCSCVMLSRSGYIEPGDGLHHPLVIISISSMSSAPFLGDLSSIDMTHVLNPLLLLVSHPKCHIPISVYRYRLSDIRIYAFCPM